MNIGVFLSSAGGSPLQVGIERGLTQLGHHVEPYREPESYDLVLMFNQVAHIPRYQYPEFPLRDVRLVFIDAAEYGYHRRLPAVISQYYNTFAPGALAHDTKNRTEQLRLKDYLDGKSFPYLIREYHAAVNWPAGYHPIDYPLYRHSECPTPPAREEFLRRPLDLFCWWGASHPWRIPLTAALRACPVRAEIGIIEQDGPRQPQHVYFAKMRAAKCCPSFDGYGSSSFRLTEALVRCVALVGPMWMRTRAPLVDGVTCLQYAVVSEGEHFIGTNIGDKVAEIVADPERAFDIYQAGYAHCWQYYTEKATAQYVLDVAAGHDYRRPTPLTFALPVSA